MRRLLFLNYYELIFQINKNEKFAIHSAQFKTIGAQEDFF